MNWNLANELRVNQKQPTSERVLLPTFWFHTNR